MNNVQFKLFLIRAKLYFKRLFTSKNKVFVSFDEAFSIDLDDINNLPCIQEQLGDYKQRGLYKNNPNFCVIKSSFIKDTVTGYIVYPDGSRSGEYSMPTVILETYFRKLPNTNT